MTDPTKDVGDVLVQQLLAVLVEQAKQEPPTCQS